MIIYRTNKVKEPRKYASMTICGAHGVRLFSFDNYPLFPSFWIPSNLAWRTNYFLG